MPSLTFLQASFVVEGKSGRKVFFGGDTAYCDAFKEIGATFGMMPLSSFSELVAQSVALE